MTVFYCNNKLNMLYLCQTFNKTIIVVQLYTLLCHFINTIKVTDLSNEGECVSLRYSYSTARYRLAMSSVSNLGELANLSYLAVISSLAKVIWSLQFHVNQLLLEFLSLISCIFCLSRWRTKLQIAEMFFRFSLLHVKAFNIPSNRRLKNIQSAVKHFDLCEVFGKPHHFLWWVLIYPKTVILVDGMFK